MPESLAFRVVIAQQLRANGRIEVRMVSPADLRDPDLLKSMVPIRHVRALRKKRARVRYQPFRNHERPPVACEGRSEALRVMELDRKGEVEWIVGQPLWLYVHRHGRLAFRHAPDFLYAFKDGGLMLENVRPPSRRTPEFLAKAEMCERFVRLQGWQYQTVGGYDGYGEEILWYLWNYALVEPRQDVVGRVVAAFRKRPIWRLGELRQECALNLADYPTLMALVWRGELAIDYHEPLSTWTQVRLGERWLP